MSETLVLPKIDVPIYDLTLPSTGETVRFRPFLVKEEKLLLIAAESKETETIIKTTKQVINNCLVDSGAINVETLPFFDIDYLIIALRAKSVGENIDMEYECNNMVEGARCGGKFKTVIDISNCVIDKPDTSITPDVKFSDKITVKMKYPTYTTMKVINGNDNIMDKKIHIIMGCIERIVNGDKIYSTKDFSKDELKGFVEGLTHEQYEKLEYFVDNLPGFAVETEGKCPKCGFEHKLKYKDFTSFFR
jgi:hypothetical protein